MTTRKLTDAATEPITLAEAKVQLGVDGDDSSQDTRIEALITAVRTECENICLRTILETEWELALDAFPERGAIALQYPPLLEVTGIQHVDVTGNVQTLAPGAWLTDFAEPARLLPAPSTRWPSARCQPRAVVVTYTAGAADVADVPKPLVLWMLLRLDQYFTGCQDDNADAMSRSSLLDGYRVY